MECHIPIISLDYYTMSGIPSTVSAMLQRHVSKPWLYRGPVALLAATAGEGEAKGVPHTEPPRNVILSGVKLHLSSI